MITCLQQPTIGFVRAPHPITVVYVGDKENEGVEFSFDFLKLQTMLLIGH